MIGQTLGNYEVLDKLGEGGMGEVYRARDTKLDRDVAVKVLPEEFAADEQRLARFDREAKLLASLNHSNIAGIYGLEESDGVKALVLELVEGPTLAERIEKGPIPIDEAIAIARQIAVALEAGHEAGIIHRDLKPANVKVKDDGTVKVLDYGLAKALEGDLPSSTESELSQSPTLTRHETQMGVILGTAAYMSPEQAKGKRVDKRTDIWAFGAVVYEMLTGKRAFGGEDVSDTLAAVLRAEPDFEALPAEIPKALRSILRLCLSKDIVQRARDMGDVRLVLGGAFDVASDAGENLFRRHLTPLVAAAFLLGAVVAGSVLWTLLRLEPAARPVTKLSLTLPPGASHPSETRTFAISPDGSRIAFVADRRIYLRNMDDVEATALPGTEGGATALFFSPDGRWVGFHQGGELKKVSVAGGAVVSLCDALSPYDALWGADDTITFADGPSGILRVSASGGVPQVVLSQENAERTFDVLPDGKTLLLNRAPPADGVWRVDTLSLETNERSVLIDPGSDARYLLTGHIVYAVEDTLFAVEFDVEGLEIVGTPVPVVNGVDATGLNRNARFHVSDNGTLVYAPARPRDEDTLVWVDRNGTEQVLSPEPWEYEYPRISPDGSRIAFEHSGSIWTWDVADEVMTRLTFDERWDHYPAWTPDGRRVAFGSNRDGTGPRIYWKPADGTGRAELLTDSDRFQRPYMFTPDGKELLFNSNDDIGVVSVDGSSEWIMEEPLGQYNAAISPDGAWLAYESGESGRYEVYVRPFPNVEGGWWQISKDGGETPAWSPDGGELFYLSLSGEMVAVPVHTEPVFSTGNPVVLFKGEYFNDTPGRHYDVSSDGRRFLMIKKKEVAINELIVVQDWFQELKRLVPTEN